VDMEKNGNDSWLDIVTNEEVLRRVNEDRRILNSIWQRKHSTDKTGERDRESSIIYNVNVFRDIC